MPFKINYDDEEFINLLTKATHNVGNLSGICRHLSNPHLLITPYLKREAVFSSRIEGTRTSLSDVFLPEEKKEEPRERDDRQEVINYVSALEYGLNQVREGMPLSEDMIKKAHEILMRNVRGETKDPGQYKIHQNWIGSTDDIFEAKFVPPHPGSVPGLIKNLVSYMNGPSPSPLVTAGVMHYQFETIHPFRDGNGRLGRMLIILYLCRMKVLEQPLLYLSAFFEKRRDEYDERLYNASCRGELEGWLKFFLEGVALQATDAQERATRLFDYREEWRRLVQERTNSTNTLTVLDYLFSSPLVTIPRLADVLKTHYPTARNSIKTLMELGILEEDPRDHRMPYNTQVFYAPKIYEILTV